MAHFARQDFRYRRFCSRALYLGFFSVTNILESRRALEKAHEKEEQVHHLVRSNAIARQEEREHLSFRLHDGAIQSMVSAFHMVEAIREMSADPPEQNAALKRAEGVLSHAIRELREVIKGLHAATPNPREHN